MPTLNKAQIDALANYKFTLVIQHKERGDYGTTIEMDGAKNIGNVFIDDTIEKIADGLIAGEKQFEQYKKEGFIAKDKDGNWNMADTHAQAMAEQSGAGMNNNEPKSVVEYVDKKEDLKGGKVD